VAGTSVAATPATRRRSLWQRYVTDTRRDVDAASAAYRSTTDARVADRKMIIVLLTSAVSLTLINFLRQAQHPGWMTTPLRAIGLHAAANGLHNTLITSPHARFWQLLVWGGVTIAGYTVLPIFAIRVLLRERVRDYGVRMSGIAPHGRWYAALYLCALPLVVLASFGGAFQQRYPFYHLAPHEGLWPYLWIWWGLYALQFVALEFFFRGFMLHGLAPRFGYASVFVMMVPYNMIHYGKPMPEALAALFGAVVLGTLSLKAKSLWWGAALHISIAATMDVLALWHAHVLL
jgi:membrane protease YdiL (CAAX protease family)